MCVIAIALVVLYRMLKGIAIGDVIAALRATPARNVALAACFVATAYFTLTVYDLFALRALGHREIPYRTAALTAFTSYAVGHNVGATVVTGGAVRYRIYSANGLDAVEVAKVCFLSALTFWLGNAAVLGLSITLQPSAVSAIDHLAPGTNRAIALGALATLASYVIWVWHWPRTIGRGGWTVKLPSGPLTLLQIVIGGVDLVSCALAMYVLLPGNPTMDFVTLAAIFVFAILLGFASHAPGGIGVFDAAMFAALSQFDKEELLAGILLFRLLYYIVPLAISLLLLGTREIAISIPSARVLVVRKQIEAALPPGKEDLSSLSVVRLGPPAIDGDAVQRRMPLTFHGPLQPPEPL